MSGLRPRSRLQVNLLCTALLAVACLANQAHAHESATHAGQNDLQSASEEGRHYLHLPQWSIFTVRNPSLDRLDRLSAWFSKKLLHFLGADEQQPCTTHAHTHAHGTKHADSETTAHHNQGALKRVLAEKKGKHAGDRAKPAHAIAKGLPHTQPEGHAHSKAPARKRLLASTKRVSHDITKKANATGIAPKPKPAHAKPAGKKSPVAQAPSAGHGPVAGHGKARARLLRDGTKSQGVLAFKAARLRRALGANGGNATGSGPSGPGAAARPAAAMKGHKSPGAAAVKAKGGSPGAAAVKAKGGAKKGGKKAAKVAGPKMKGGSIWVTSTSRRAPQPQTALGRLANTARKAVASIKMHFFGRKSPTTTKANQTRRLLSDMGNAFPDTFAPVYGILAKGTPGQTLEQILAGLFPDAVPTPTPSPEATPAPAQTRAYPAALPQLRPAPRGEFDLRPDILAQELLGFSPDEAMQAATLEAVEEAYQRMVYVNAEPIVVCDQFSELFARCHEASLEELREIATEIEATKAADEAAELMGEENPWLYDDGDDEAFDPIFDVPLEPQENWEEEWDTPQAQIRAQELLEDEDLEALIRAQDEMPLDSDDDDFMAMMAADEAAYGDEGEWAEDTDEWIWEDDPEDMAIPSDQVIDVSGEGDMAYEDDLDLLPGWDTLIENEGPYPSEPIPLSARLWRNQELADMLALKINEKKTHSGEPSSTDASHLQTRALTDEQNIKALVTKLALLYADEATSPATPTPTVAQPAPAQGNAVARGSNVDADNFNAEWAALWDESTEEEMAAVAAAEQQLLAEEQEIDSPEFWDEDDPALIGSGDDEPLRFPPINGDDDVSIAAALAAADQAYERVNAVGGNDGNDVGGVLYTPVLAGSLAWQGQAAEVADPYNGALITAGDGSAVFPGVQPGTLGVGSDAEFALAGLIPEEGAEDATLTMDDVAEPTAAMSASALADLADAQNGGFGIDAPISLRAGGARDAAGTIWVFTNDVKK